MKPFDVTVLVGGQAGQGIQTVGQMLATVGHRAGFYIMAVNDFESRIRGGHNYFRLRISDKPVHAPHPHIHLIVALDERTYGLHKDKMVDGGRVLIPSSQDQTDLCGIQVDFIGLAKEAGGRIMSNTVAAGACLALLGAPQHLFEQILNKQFSAKSEKILQNNLKAAALGFEAVASETFEYAMDWDAGAQKGRIMDGAQALALGAAAGDCRFGAFYPMSPATSVMAHLVNMAPSLPLVIEQAEDEIAAVNMVIGASFAGARALTATSGGGFSLMTEGLGLAAITETPVVVINAMRPGPATGLPTRTAQADLLFAINASQDDFPRFVFAPSTPHEAYQVTARAFDLTDRFQVPAIILVDQYFNDSIFTAVEDFAIPQTVERYIIDDQQMDDPQQYRRFQLVDGGISPRALPCAGKALVKVCSDEHDEYGHMTEEISLRNAMTDKRHAKLPAMHAQMQPPHIIHSDSDILLASWGSTRGAVQEAVAMLRAQGIDVGSVHWTDMWPFNTQAAQQALGQAKHFYMVEQNHSAQLGFLIRQQTGLQAAGNVLKYDGRPFYPQEIVTRIQAQVR